MSIDQNDYQNGLLKKVVATDGELKEFLVNYTGNKILPEDDNITVEMIIETIASEFPELLLAIAEENYLRGYAKGLDDIAPTPENNNV
jgi:hypothetical protein